MDTTKYNFKHQLPIQVRMSDIDPIGHVNNSVQLSYYDLGRLNYLEKLQNKKIVWAELDMVIVHVSCDFMQSIYINDLIAVETKVLEIGEKSVKMIQRIIQTDTGEIKSTCYAVMAGYDKEKDCSKPISEEFKQRFFIFEN